MTAAVMADLAFAIGSNKVIHLKLKGRLKKEKIEWADNMRQEMGASHPLKNRRKQREFGIVRFRFQPVSFNSGRAV